ncbi:MAG: prephenate dehydratase domain-containing protein [Maricaulaceae bacterium]
MSFGTQIIGYFGVPGSYTHQAAEELYPDAKLIGFKSIFDVIKNIELGEVLAGVVPVENSTAGRVAELYQLLDIIDLSITAEHFVEIRHCLTAHTEDGEQPDDLSHVEHIFSHKQAIMQCRDWLGTHLPLVKQTEAANTADAAERISLEKNPRKAAICSRRAAEIYGLTVLRDNIQDFDKNVTRFHVLQKQAASPATLSDKAITTVIFQVPHTPGALLKALSSVSAHGANIIKLETYMVSGMRAAPTFYVDIAANRYSNDGEKVLSDLVDATSFLKVIGCYNASEERGNVTGFLPV